MIAIGARFDDPRPHRGCPAIRGNFPHTELIQIDVEHAETDRNYLTTRGIIADERTFLRQVLAELDGRETMLERRTTAWL